MLYVQGKLELQGKQPDHTEAAKQRRSVEGYVSKPHLQGLLVWVYAFTVPMMTRASFSTCCITAAISSSRGAKGSTYSSTLGWYLRSSSAKVNLR